MKIEVNRLPSPTMSKLQMNYAVIDDAVVTESALKNFEGTGITVQEQCYQCTGAEADELFEGRMAHEITVCPDAHAVAVLNFPDAAQMGNAFLISVPAGIQGKLVFHMLSDKDSSGFAAVKFKVQLGEGSALHIVQLNRLGDGFTVVSNLDARQEKDSSLTLTTISLGAASSYFGAETALVGEGSAFDTNTAYILEKNQKLDMNYTALHTGKKTESHITASGALKEGSYKVSRQTINFLTGCSGSTGEENEEALLLDDDIVNKSVPLILCTEEDVEGVHGATIGQIDEDLQYYMQSRGLDEETVYKLLSTGRVIAASERADDDKTTALVLETLGLSEDSEA